MTVIKDTILGFVVADALGVPVEFESREYLKKHKITEMEEYMSYMEPKGTWSDDSSTVLATIDSIVKQKQIDYDDIMNNFIKWYKENEFTATGRLFDIGRTTKDAFENYLKGVKSTEAGMEDISDNGNGSLMRMLPIALYTYYKNINNDYLYEIVKDTSSLTHKHPISVMASFIYCKYMHFLIETKDKLKSYELLKNIDYSKYFEDKVIAKFNRFFSDIYNMNIDNIDSTGYVISTLESALWSVINHETYKEAVIEAVNLGEDTDTIGAITGSLISVLDNNIPTSWLCELKNRQLVDKLSTDFEKCLIK